MFRVQGSGFRVKGLGLVNLALVNHEVALGAADAREARVGGRRLLWGLGIRV